MDNQDPFAGMTEGKSPQVKFGMVGDWFKGTLVDNTREVPNKLSTKKEMQRVYEFKMIGGSFHGIEEKTPGVYTPLPDATPINKDEFYSYFAKAVVQGQMRNAKVGQIIGMRRDADKPPSQPGLHPTHIIKVYLGEMDPTYQGEMAADMSDVK